MNFGMIVRNALQRAELPFDIEHLELARAFANDNISDLYYLVKADFREVTDTISVVASTDEYAMPKTFDRMVLNSLRGPSSNPRNIIYKDPIEWYRFTRNYSSSTGVPNIFTFGALRGYDTQLPAASVLKITSSLANKTGGTVSVVPGSVVIKGSGTSFTLADVGLRFLKSGDTDSYVVGKYVSATEVWLDSPYRGQLSTGSSYAIGDVDIHVVVSGVVAGVEDSEDVVLSGTTVLTTSKTFTTVSGVVKSQQTGGIVTVTDNAGTTTVVTLSPNDIEVERQTILLWRIPSADETLTYRYYRKHPVLRMDTDRCLIPNKYHGLISRLTEEDLRGWADKAIPATLARKIAEGKEQFIDDASDSSLWVTIPQEEGLGFGLTDVNNRSIDQDFVAI